MAGFTRSVTLRCTPEEVFPWLLEADRVPQWASGVERYEVSGPLAAGARVRQRLAVSGQTVDVDMEVVRYDPPWQAETRFSTNGIDVVNVYALAAEGSGTRLSQSLEAKGHGLAARLLMPVVQPRLERKLDEDLGRLAALLGGE